MSDSDSDPLGMGGMVIGADMGDKPETPEKQEPVKQESLPNMEIDMNAPPNIRAWREAGLTPFKLHKDVRFVCGPILDNDGNIVGITKKCKDIHTGEILKNVPFVAGDVEDDREDGITCAVRLGLNQVHIDVDSDNRTKELSDEFKSFFEILTGCKFWPSGTPGRGGAILSISPELFKEHGYSLNKIGNIKYVYKSNPDLTIEFRVCLEAAKCLKVFVPDGGNYKGPHYPEYSNIRALETNVIKWMCDNGEFTGSGVRKLAASSSTTTTTTTDKDKKEKKTIGLNTIQIENFEVKGKYRAPVFPKKDGLEEILKLTQETYASYEGDFFAKDCEVRIALAMKIIEMLNECGFDVRHNIDTYGEEFITSIINFRWQLQDDQSIDKLNMQKAMDLIMFVACREPCYYSKDEGEVREEKIFDNAWMIRAHEMGFCKTINDNKFDMPITSGPNKGEPKFRFDPNYGSGALRGIIYKEKEILLLAYIEDQQNRVAVAEMSKKIIRHKPNNNAQSEALWFETLINDFKQTKKEKLPDDYAHGVRTVHMVREPRKAFGFTGEYEDGLPVFNSNHFQGQLKILTGNVADTSKFRYPIETITFLDKLFRSDDLKEWQESEYNYEQEQEIKAAKTDTMTRTVKLVDGVYHVKEVWKRKKNLHRDYFEKSLAFKAFIPMRDQITYLMGIRRIGKDFMINTILNALFGDSNVSHDCTVKDLIEGNYNSSIANSLFVVLSDPGQLNKKQARELGDYLKSITGKAVIQVRQKYKDNVPAVNNMTFVISSNYSLPISGNDRIVQSYISGWRDDCTGELTDDPDIKDIRIDTSEGVKVGVAAQEHILQQEAPNYAYYLFKTHAPDGANSAANLAEHFRINDSPMVLERMEYDNSVHENITRSLGSVFKHIYDTNSVSYNEAVDRLVRVIAKRKMFRSEALDLQRLFINQNLGQGGAPFGGMLYGLIPLRCLLYMINYSGLSELKDGTTFGGKYNNHISEDYIKKLLLDNQVELEMDEDDMERLYEGSPYLKVPKFAPKFVKKMVDMGVLLPGAPKVIVECKANSEELQRRKDELIKPDKVIGNAVINFDELLEIGKL